LSLSNKNDQTEISGNTLRVYWYILKKRQDCGVREVQRALGFSSSSTAHYHLEKLATRGILVKNSYGNYKVNDKTRVRMINPFILIRGFVFPKQLFYATATSIMCLAFIMFFWKFLTLTVVIALTPGILACVIFWYETVKLSLSLPSFKEGVR